MTRKPFMFVLGALTLAGALAELPASARQGISLDNLSHTLSINHRRDAVSVAKQGSTVKIDHWGQKTGSHSLTFRLGRDKRKRASDRERAAGDTSGVSARSDKRAAKSKEARDGQER